MTNMSGRILIGPSENEADTIFPNISYGKIIFDILSERTDCVAMINGESKEQITTKELLNQSIQAAMGMKKLGIGKNDIVGIVFENHLQYFVPMFASLYLGAIVHPVNPAYTIRELKHVFDISKPKAVFTSETYIKSIMAVKEDVNYINNIIVFGTNNFQEALDFEVLLKLGCNINNFIPCKINVNDDVACILCSSGTTGLPKCVMLTHNNIRMTSISLIDGNYGACTKSDCTVSVLPFFHIFGMLVNLAGLLSGMRIIILPKFKPELYLSTIQDYKVTKLFIAPPLGIFLNTSPLVNNYDLTSINYVLCGGAPLGTEVQNMLNNKFNIRVKQGYGTTEATFIALMPFKAPLKIGSVGKLLYGQMLKVTDLNTNATLGANEIGEISTKNNIKLKGYLRNEEETLNMFDKEGFMHSGDIGYYDDDGFIYIVDRLKELIKYKGFQVPPAEIESLLISHKDIVDAGVIGIPDDKAGEVALAFVAKKTESLITEKEIILYIAENLSIQKQLHGGVRFIDAIPRSASGKILRKDLRRLVTNNN